MPNRAGRKYQLRKKQAIYKGGLKTELVTSEPIVNRISDTERIIKVQSYLDYHLKTLPVILRHTLQGYILSTLNRQFPSGRPYIAEPECPSTLEAVKNYAYVSPLQRLSYEAEDKQLGILNSLGCNTTKNSEPIIPLQLRGKLFSTTWNSVGISKIVRTVFLIV